MNDHGTNTAVPIKFTKLLPGKAAKSSQASVLTTPGTVSGEEAW
jgi:hypothetical protein